MQETSLEYRQCLTEVNFILQHTEETYLKKIPLKFRKFLLDNEDKNYKVSFDVNKDFGEWKLKPKTKSLLALIYRDYFCNLEQKNAYDKIIRENQQKREEELREKYNPDNIFKKHIQENKIEENSVENEIALVEYKESIFDRFINKIKSIFHID